MIMWVDINTSWLQSVRYHLGYVLKPGHDVALFPRLVVGLLGESADSRSKLLDDNKQLKARNLVLQQRVQRLAYLEAENITLRELLSASEQVDDKVLVTSVTSIDPDPRTYQVLLDKGGEDGVFIGQPVLDAKGLMGQVIDVLPNSSKVLLIADSNHVIPVQVNRNGVRAIAVGTGSLDTLELLYVASTADINVGDYLVSSGLGGRYPQGYPVGIVSSVERPVGEPFIKVQARPSARLDSSRHLLLVFRAGAGRVPPDNLWRKVR